MTRHKLVTVRKSWSFDAAHVLPHHNGKCAQPHGHTYTVTVEVQGPTQPLDGRPDGGMVVDFYVLTQAWKAIEPLLDHRDLQRTLCGGPEPLVEATTSELMAQWLLGYFSDEPLPPGAKVTAVSVSETPSSQATARWAS